MAAPKLLQPLRHRPFRRIFAGQLASGMGDWLDYVGIIVLVAYVWDLGAGALASVAVAAAVPWVLVAPLAGVWADRLPTRTVLIGCDLVRMVVVLGYFVAPNLPVLLALLVLKVSFGTLFVPAEQSAIKRVVPAADLLAATSLTTVTNQATKVVGPAIGGVLVATVGPRGTFLIDAATFALSALILAGMPRLQRSEPEAADSEGGSFWRELREGLAYVVSNPTVRAATISMSATVFLVFTFDTLAALALKALGMPAAYLGFAMAGVGLGTVAGTIAIGQWGQRFDPLRILGGSQVAAGAFVAVIGLAVVLQLQVVSVVWLAVAIGIGLSAAGILVTFPYLLQRETPDNLIGRVVATAGAIPTVMQLLAPPIGAVAAEAFGTGSVFAAAGTGLAVVGLVLVGTRIVTAAGGRLRGIAGRALMQPDVVAHMAGHEPTTTPGPVPLSPARTNRSSVFW